MKQLALPKISIPDGCKMACTLKWSVAWRRGSLIVAAGLLALIAGCQEEAEIRRYQEPRAETKREPWRLLGAIIPHEKQVWFFRLEGPPVQIAEQKTKFDQFVQTIRFTGDAKEAIAWKVPEGWEQDKGDSQFRYATMRMGPKGKDGRPSLEMTVIPLPRKDGAESILKNICRWRDQLGLEPIPDSRLGENTRNIKVDDVPVTLVDIAGFQPVKKMPRFAHPQPQQEPRAARPVRKSPLTFKPPDGWEKKPTSGFRFAAFAVGDAEVTVIPLGRMAGSVLANVNRWRDDVKLDHIGEAHLAKDVKDIVIDGEDGHYVDLTGPQKRVLAVMVPRADATWFFKMIGPIDVVGREKPTFEGFVRSVKFTGQGD